LREEARELRSQLEQERAYKKEVEDECWDKEESLNQTRAELAAALAEVAVLKQKSVTASVDLPEAADLLNKLKAKRKKSPVTLADIEAILEMIEEF
jgi:chromosome segregation ATPase